jgi:hypothetical protein
MSLTREQRKALWLSDGSPFAGHAAVSARPGTGKTTTVTEYCIDLSERWSEGHKPWQGMAVLSYTNVAREELAARIRKRGTAGALLNNPHFVGTIDAFVNQYIFLPFGAGQMEYAGGRPTLVGEPYSVWRAPQEMERDWPQNLKRKPLLFDCYTLDADDFPLVVDRVPRTFRLQYPQAAKEPTKGSAKDIRLMKRHIWSYGLATQADANYLAYMTLVSSPLLTRSLVARFPVLVIDEAQDMTAVQHALLSHLIVAGQHHVVLVGDEYQAIYEWNTAKPSLFTARKAEKGWISPAISETFRCSPAVCKVLGSMTPDGEAVRVASVGKNRHYSQPVQVKRYDAADERSDILAALDDMAKSLTGSEPHDNDEGIKTVAVVGRAGHHASRIQAFFAGKDSLSTVAPEWAQVLTREYLRVVHSLVENDLFAAFAAYETLLYRASDYRTKDEMRRSLADEWASGDADPLVYRRILVGDLAKIQDRVSVGEDVRISDAADSCEVDLTAMPAKLLRRIGADCTAFAKSKQSQDQMLSGLFAAKDERVLFAHPSYEDVRFVFSTIHGVKGETYDGVIFYTRAETDACNCPKGTSARKWTKILTHDLAECEHKRLAYVALSRAAQVLYVLAPDESVSGWSSLIGTE